jgi:hypothetical protein
MSHGWADAIAAVNEKFIPGRPDERPQLIDAESAIAALQAPARERLLALRQRVASVRREQVRPRSA